MNDDGYSSSRLKLDRAEQHIADFERRRLAVPAESYSIRIDVHPDTGRHSVKFQSEPIGPGFSLIFGDAVTNLRAALDHCYVSALGITKRSGQVFFPIRDTGKALIRAINNGKKQWPIPESLCDLLLKTIQPYDGGHPTLTALNKLANTDKHRLLISFMAVAGVTMSYSTGSNSFNDITFGGKAGEELVIITAPGPINFHGDPKPLVQIYIGEREPRIFYGQPVVPTLSRLADDVRNIIDLISSTIPR